MSSKERYQVVLLPAGELAVDHCTLAEALAFQRGYHEVVEHGRQKAAIASEAVDRLPGLASSGRMASSSQTRRSA